MCAFLAALLNQAVLKARVKGLLDMAKCSTKSYFCHLRDPLACDVDHSRVIDTTSVVPVSRQVREKSHLVIRHNTTRNVGVVRHNHTIVEREMRYLPRRPVVTVINFVVRNYRTTHRPHSTEVDPIRLYETDCTRNGRGACGGPLRVRG